MAITEVGLATGNNGNNTTNVTLTFGTVSVGQLVVVCGMKYSPSTTDVFELADISTYTDTTATVDTWTLDKQNGGNDGEGSGCFSAVWSTTVTGAGQLNLQISGATSGSYLLIAAEAFNGTWDSSRVENTNGQLATANNFTAGSTLSVTTADAGLMVGCIAANTTTANTFTPDGAFTTIYENETGTDDNGSAIYRIVSTGTTDAGDWTVTGSNNGYSASIVAYKEAAVTDPVSLIPIIQPIIMR
jgi:hypothetical protein